MTLDEAEAAERAAFAEIGRLGDVELTAVKVWVASNCEGRRPQPNVEARRVLADRLAAAMAAREAAERAAGWRAGSEGQSPPSGEIAATDARCGAARAA